MWILNLISRFFTRSPKPVARNLIIGLTGGIGSGKSTVGKFFADLGIQIIDADTIAREVVTPHSESIDLIANHFGKDIILADGHLNRALLRKKIFDNPLEKIWLETLLHPLIIAEIKKQTEQSTSSYCIAIIPLLFEAKLTALVDRILVVDASETTQINNTMTRDHCSRASVIKIMSTQVSRQFRLDHADEVIHNDSDLMHLKQQVLKMHGKYKDLIKSKLSRGLSS
jgi:dephospho-CoA kinase